MKMPPTFSCIGMFALPVREIVWDTLGGTALEEVSKGPHHFTLAP